MECSEFPNVLWILLYYYNATINIPKNICSTWLNKTTFLFSNTMYGSCSLEFNWTSTCTNICTKTYAWRAKYWSVKKCLFYCWVSICKPSILYFVIQLVRGIFLIWFIQTYFNTYFYRMFKTDLPLVETFRNVLKQEGWSFASR